MNDKGRQQRLSGRTAFPVAGTSDGYICRRAGLLPNALHTLELPLLEISGRVVNACFSTLTTARHDILLRFDPSKRRDTCVVPHLLDVRLDHLRRPGRFHEVSKTHMHQWDYMSGTLLI